ncbi:hypothetical protein TcG_07272, partial [Trypanosoma cruzi]
MLHNSDPRRGFAAMRRNSDPRFRKDPTGWHAPSSLSNGGQESRRGLPNTMGGNGAVPMSGMEGVRGAGPYGGMGGNGAVPMSGMEGVRGAGPYGGMGGNGAVPMSGMEGVRGAGPYGGMGGNGAVPM